MIPAAFVLSDPPRRLFSCAGRPYPAHLESLHFLLSMCPSFVIDDFYHNRSSSLSFVHATLVSLPAIHRSTKTTDTASFGSYLSQPLLLHSAALVAFSDRQISRSGCSSNNSEQFCWERVCTWDKAVNSETSEP